MNAQHPTAGAVGSLTVLVAGASGLVGTALRKRLEDDGHTVLRLVRRAPKHAAEFHWSPATRILDTAVMEQADAVINLSGASLSRMPWTPGYRKTLLNSRLDATRTLSDAIAHARNTPRIFLSGSACGFYGDQPGMRLTEDSPVGSGFLAELAEQWEAAALVPDEVRLVHLRTGLVLAPHGGALAPLKTLTRFGLGARIGSGGQHWPWISLEDEVGAIVHLLHSRMSGPVNLVGPTPATVEHLTEELARQLKRARPFGAPDRLISALLGAAGRELLLSSQKIVPERLLADGYRFAHPTVAAAISAALGRQLGLGPSRPAPGE